MKKIDIRKNIKYSFCSCGLSKKLPFCDNEHRNFNKKNNTNYKSIKITAKENIIIEIESSTWNLKTKKILNSK